MATNPTPQEAQTRGALLTLTNDDLRCLELDETEADGWSESEASLHRVLVELDEQRLAVARLEGEQERLTTELALAVDFGRDQNWRAAQALIARDTERQRADTAEARESALAVANVDLRSRVEALEQEIATEERTNSEALRQMHLRHEAAEQRLTEERDAEVATLRLQIACCYDGECESDRRGNGTCRGHLAVELLHRTDELLALRARQDEWKRERARCEAAESRVSALEQKRDALMLLRSMVQDIYVKSEPCTPGGQQVGTQRYQMTISTRQELRRALEAARDAARGPGEG